MLNFTEARIDQIIIHKVGNRSHEEGFELSREVKKLDESTEHILLHFFLKQFDGNKFYSFADDGNRINGVKSMCDAIFQNNDIVIQSCHIVDRLYDVSTHPKIKGGDLYVALIKDIVIDDELVDAIGIFKSETRDMFLNVKYSPGTSADVLIETGVNITKIDKACLIFNTE